VILVLAVVFVRQMRVMQGQGELESVKSTLGALRTAFVIDHLHKNVVTTNAPVTPVQRNPFELLQHRPVNYAGEIRQTQTTVAPVGAWVFDADCACVGYAPLDAQWLESSRGNAVIWFQISGDPGPLQLTAKQTYIWQGQLMN
jgi:hypothetical protein